MAHASAAEVDTMWEPGTLFDLDSEDLPSCAETHTDSVRILEDSQTHVQRVGRNHCKCFDLADLLATRSSVFFFSVFGGDAFT